GPSRGGRDSVGAEWSLRRARAAESRRLRRDTPRAAADPRVERSPTTEAQAADHRAPPATQARGFGRVLARAVRVCAPVGFPHGPQDRLALSGARMAARAEELHE